MADIEAQNQPNKDVELANQDVNDTGDAAQSHNTEVPHDFSHMSRSYFKQEGKATLGWLIFTTAYWTLVVWIPTLIDLSFATAGFFGWCVGFIALIAAWYTWREGRWPSGATKHDENETSGIGRYTAFGVTFCVCVDLLILSFYSIRDGTGVAAIFKGSCHMISLIWATLFFFNRFNVVNPDIAVTAFFGEWLDVGLSIVVIFVLHNALDDSDTAIGDANCFDTAICIVYYICFVLQLMGWLFPMMLLEGWGTEKDGKKVSTHLFILDLLTDIPIILAILIEDAYKTHVIIFIDVMWKTCLTIRSIGYYVIYEIWLQKGQRVFRRNRGDTLK